MRNRLIRETKNFVAFPSVSPLGPGHVLLCPRDHYSSMIQMPAAHVREFLRIAKSLVCDVENAYHSMVLFEHGVGRGQEGGCGVTHAHLHILPASSSTQTVITNRVCADYRNDALGTFCDMMRRVPHDQSYLLLGSSLQSIRYFVGAFPSQYMRKIIASILHLPLSDWRCHFGWGEFAETYTRLTENVLEAHQHTKIAL